MATKKKAKKRAATAAPKAGAAIEREFKGKTYKLRVTDEGYAIGKKTFKSLTAAAKHVTGYPSVSGPRFWGADENAKGGAA